MKKAIFFLLLVAPVFYSGVFSVMDMREQQFWVLLAGCASLIALCIKNKIIGYGILYCLAHLAFYQRPAYINSMVQILCHVLIYALVAIHYKGKNYKWAILAVLCANLAMALLQYLKQDVFLQIGMFTDQTPGLMTLPVYIGLYSAVVAPVLCLIHPALVILAIIGVIISKSSFAAIALFVSMSFFWWATKSRIWRVWLLSGLAGILVFISFYDGPTGQFSRRLHIWRQVLSVTAINPWGGWGIGSYDRHIRFVEIGNADKTRKYLTFQPHKPEQVEKLMSEMEFVAVTEIGNTKVDELKKCKSLQEAVEWFRRNGSDIYFWNDPHNFFILVWMEGGLPLLILVLWYIFDVWRRYYRVKYCIGIETVALFSSFIAVVIISGAHFAIQLPRISITIMILLGCLERNLRRLEEEKTADYVDIKKW